MLASVELPQDFKLLNRQFQGLVQALLDEIEVPSVRVEVAPTQSGNFRGFDGSRFYIVESGTVTVRYANRSCLPARGRRSSCCRTSVGNARFRMPLPTTAARPAPA
jgi:hypothetical protein